MDDGHNIGRWADEIHIGIVSIIPGQCSQVTSALTWEHGIVSQMSCDEVTLTLAEVCVRFLCPLILLGIFLYLL